MAKFSGQSRQGINVWPGFVDSLSTLILVVVFMLLIFAIAQQVLSISLATTSDSLDSYKSENAALANSNQTLKGQVEEARDALALARIRNAELTDQLGETDQNRQSLADERTRNTAQISSLNNQIVALNERSADLARELEQSERRNIDLLAQLGQSERSDRARAETVRELNQTRQDLETRLATNQTLMLDVTRRLATLLESYGDPDANEKELTILLSEENLRENMISGVSASSALYDRITELVANTQLRLETLIIARDQALSRLQTVQEQALRDKSIIDGQTADLAFTRDQLAQTLADLETANTALENRDQEQGQEIARRDYQLQIASAEIEAYKIQLFDASAEIAKLIAEADQAEANYTQAILERDQVSAELVDAYEKISASEAEVALLAADLDNFGRLRRILEDQVESLRSERGSLETELQSLAQQREQLQRELTAVNAAFAELSNGKSVLEATNTAIEFQLSETVNLLEQVEAARDLAISQAARSNQLREQETLARIDAESRIQGLESQIARLLENLGSQQLENQGQSRQLVSQALAIENLQNERLTLQQTNIDLNAKIADLETIATLAESAISAREQQLIALSAANKALNDKLAAELEARRLREELETQNRYRSSFIENLATALIDRSDVQFIDERFVLPSDVLFDFNSTSLSTEGQNEIRLIGRRLIEIARDIPGDIGWVLRIDGHTDAPGSDQTNWRISTARAQAVADLLMQAQVPPSRLMVAGFGEHQLLIPTEQANSANRRIELRIVPR